MTRRLILLAFAGAQLGACGSGDGKSPFDSATAGSASSSTGGSGSGAATGGSGGSGGATGSTGGASSSTGGSGGSGGGSTGGGSTGGGGGPLCGNGDIDPGEECDAINLGGKTCEDLGFPGGLLSCNPDCTFHTESCDLACGAAGDFCKKNADCCEGFTCDTFFEECEGA